MQNHYDLDHERTAGLLTAALVALSMLAVFSVVLVWTGVQIVKEW